MSEEKSHFWRELSSRHAAVLARVGPESCKRVQAFEYFTWVWSLGVLRRDPAYRGQLRFLLGNTPATAWIRAALSQADLSDGAWEGLDWPRRKRWLYVVMVRVLWEYAQRHDPAGVTKLAEPELGDPPPVSWGGRLISQDLANSALEVAAIQRALGDRRPRSILEVGAGYGRLAYALMSIYPEARYTVVDIDPAIDLSRWYLTSLFPPARLRFLAPSQANEIETGTVDLALSVSSFQEMTPAQVEGYLGLFNRVAAGGGVYLKQWANWHNPVDDVDARFDDYPIPPGWRELYREQAPVHTHFKQAAWSVPSAKR